MIDFGGELSDIAHALVINLHDSYALTRARLTYWLMSGHLHNHVRAGLPVLEAAVESTSVLGDRILSLLTLGTIALLKFYASDDLSEVENFCTYAPDEFNDHATDLRGGMLLVTVKQVARALQGKTRFQSPLTVLSDGQHDSQAYVKEVISQSSNPDRMLDVYYSLAIIPLYLYEHYEEAVSIGESRMPTIDELWSMRASRLLTFYLSLSHFAILRRDISKSNRADILGKIRKHKERIQDWGKVNDVNYAMWSSLLAAESCDATGDSNGAMQGYEDALSHSHAHGFMLEEAMTNELTAGFYIRRGAKRAAQAFAKDAVVAYRQLGAHGKADQVVEKFKWLLKLQLGSRVTEAETQTNSPGDTTGGQYQSLAVVENENQIKRDQGEESNQDRTRDWVGPESSEESNQVPGLGIDVIDLQSQFSFGLGITVSQDANQRRYFDIKPGHLVRATG